MSAALEISGLRDTFPTPLGDLVAVRGVDVAVSVAVPRGVWPLNTVTVLPGSAVIVRVGAASFVTAPLLRVPVRGATSSLTPVMVGDCGAAVSTVAVKAAEDGPRLPTPSTIRTV